MAKREMQHGTANVGGWAVRLVAQYVVAWKKLKGWLLAPHVVLSQENDTNFNFLDQGRE